MNCNSTAAKAFSRMKADACEEFADMKSLWQRLADLKKVQVDQEMDMADVQVTVERPEDAGKEWNGMDWILTAGLERGQKGFTEHAFGQFCQSISFPQSVLMRCPMHLAQSNVTFFSMASQEKRVLLRMQEKNIRAWLSQNYQAVDHHEIVGRLMESGVKWDVNFAGLTPKRMFILGVDPDAKWDGPDGSKLNHCTLVGNSETGEGTFFAQDLWFDHVCSNRNIWGWKIRGGRFDRVHRGNVRDGLKDLMQWITASHRQAEEAAVAAIRKSATEFVPETDEKIVEWVRNFGIGVGVAEKAVASAHDRWPGKRLSRFNIMSGLTKVAQSLQADARYDLEMAASELVTV